MRLHITALYLKKYCQLAEECVCCPAPVISAECHPRHRVSQNDSSQCLQRWSLGREKNRTDRNFILPSISKWLLSALHQSGETGTVHFYSWELDCGEGFQRETGWEGERRKLQEKWWQWKAPCQPLAIWIYDSRVKIMPWQEGEVERRLLRQR